MNIFVKTFDDFFNTGNELDKSADYKQAEAQSKITKESEEESEENEVLTLTEIGENITEIIKKLNNIRKNESDEKATKVMSSLVSDLMKVEDKINSFTLTSENDDKDENKE